HMFSTGLDLLPISFFSAASFTIAIPSGISIFAWLATIWGGRVSLTPAMLFVLGFIVTFVIGGITGVMVAMVPFDWQVHDSFFVVAHFHYVLVGGVVFPIFAALYHWWPKMSGRALSAPLGHIAFWLVFIGFNVTFFPQHIVGMLGMPRRIYTYDAGLGWEIYNLISTAGYFVLAVGVIVFVVDVLQSWARGPEVGDDPWQGDTLEWATSSPPPPYNFERLPTVHSRSPMWEDRTPERDHDVDRLDDPMAQGREVVTTSVLDGAPDAVLRMPEPSYLPLVAALSLVLVYGGGLTGAWAVSGIGLAMVGLTVAAWLWRAPEDAPQRVEAIRRHTRLPFAWLTGPHAPGRWGMVLFVVTEGVLFGSMISSYFLVRGNSPEWPQGGISHPELLVPGVLTAIIALSSVSMWWTQTREEDETGRARGLRVGLLLTLLLGVAFLALQAFEYGRADFGPTTNAYGSLFFAITGMHAIHLGLGVLMLGWVLARTWFVSHEPGHRSDVPAVSFYWHFVGVVWLLILSVVYLAVRWI
ncbi:MAG: cbb3-type cytochrome c oxidase subunit I, partial [Dehalococcoidia bacterium]